MREMDDNYTDDDSLIYKSFKILIWGFAVRWVRNVISKLEQSTIQHEDEKLDIIIVVLL